MRRFFIILTLLMAVTAFADDTNTFCPAICCTNTPPLIDVSKEVIITNGITLGQVVTNLGPGWMPGGKVKLPDGREVEVVADILMIQWNFTDGHQLVVLPKTGKASDVLSSDGHTGSKFWFRLWP